MLVASLSEDRKTVHLKGDLWSGSFPVKELRHQLDFYRGLRDRKGGKYAGFYQWTVASLEAVGRQLREAG